jgi:protein-S-isoprenylcysteine O-methyltransferase Ste14
MIARLIGVLIFAAITCVVIVVAGGGEAFLYRPVGAAYLALWAMWWLAIALGRRRGAPSAYDRSQRTLVALGIVALVGLIVVTPWEYAHLAGPIPRDGPLAWVGLLLFAAGIILQVAAFWALRGLYTSRLGVQPGHHLVTGGPYRLVRHPGYLSNLMCLTGIGLSLSSLVAIGATIFVVPLILRRIASEEAMLLAEFGAEYQAYQQQTTKRLVPGVY